MNSCKGVPIVTVSTELARLLAREVLGRQVGDDLLAETAARLSGLLERVRSLDQRHVAHLEPAVAFDPAHPAWQQEPGGMPAWQQLGQAAPGSSGYGAAGPAAPAGAAAAPSAAAAPGGAPPAPHGHLLQTTLTEMAARIRRREVSPVELVRAALERLEALEPRLNAFVTVTPERALAEARAAEASLNRGRPVGPLHGIPIALKDLIATAGIRTTGGSRVLANHVPDHDATVVTRLRAAGAISLGKSQTHEFAFGPTTNNPHYGPCRNPWAPDRVSGGSSGGSGAAVAAGVAFMGMGTDTGGSIRIPAAACGIVGLKPTYGRVSRSGILPLSWSLDHAGPLTRSVADAALTLQVLAGPDPLDHTAAHAPIPDYLAAAEAGRAGLQGLRIGVAANWLANRVEPAVRDAVLTALRTIEGLGARVVEVELPPADTMMLVNRLIALAEAGAYHAAYLVSQADEYGEDVRARMELGQMLLARDYLLGQRLRGELARSVNSLFRQVDLIASPTLPIVAPVIGQTNLEWPGGTETVAEALIRLTAPFNVTGHPAITLPCGLTPAGLPVGLQLAGRAFDEETVIRAAAAYEAAAGLAMRPPGL